MKRRRSRAQALFVRRPGDDNTVLNWVSSAGTEHQEYRLMGEAYLSAAKVLVRKWSGSTPFTDFDAYPVVFLYRHALELLMKSLVVAGRTRLAIRTKGIEGALGGHSLTKLWPIVSSVLDAMGWTKDTPEGRPLHESRKLIDQLNSADPQSMSFRYPRSKRGGDLLPSHLTFNLPDSAKLVNSLCDSLLGAAIAIENFPPGGD